MLNQILMVVLAPNFCLIDMMPYVSTLRAEDPRTHERRLVVPPSIVKAVGWSTGSKLELVREAIEPGRIKLHLAEAIKSKLRSKKAELEGSDAPERDQVLAAFQYQYMPVTLSPGSNNQLVLPSTAAFHLEIGKSTSADVYVETDGETIDILSLQYIATRQRQLVE